MNLAKFLKKYWPLIAIILIIGLSIHIRTIDYRWPYLRNIDSYAFLREMEQIVEHGGLATFDPLALAPNNVGEVPPTEFGIAPYQQLGAYSYMFFRLFAPDMQLWEYMIWFPAVLASLAAIPMYFIGKYLYDRRVGVLSAFFVLFDISNVSRSLGGDPDSDAMVILMPLIVIALFLYTYKHVNKKGMDKLGLVYSVITGIAMFFWRMSWVGYWYVVWLLLGFVVLLFISDVLRKRSVRKGWNVRKGAIYSVVIILVVLFALDIPLSGVSTVGATFQGPFSFGDIKSEEGREFPNVYVSVAELQPGNDLRTIIQRTTPIDIGSNPAAALISPFFLLIYALFYLVYSFYRRREHLDTLLLLLIWFVGPLAATIVAIRFTILFAAPMAIGTAIVLAKLWSVANKEGAEK